MSQDDVTAKTKLRRTLILHREQHHPMHEKEGHIEHCQRHILDFLNQHAFSCIGGYHAYRSEVPLPQDVCAVMALPRLSEENLHPSSHHLPQNVMHFHKVQDDLVCNRYGILEPQSHAPKVLPDCFLVPCVAMDQKGYRLGYGGGYYDRYFKTLKQQHPHHIWITMGICLYLYTSAIFPHESHDIPMNGMITNAGWVFF